MATSASAEATRSILSFDDLDGWAADDHGAALSVFLNTCGDLDDPDWRALCSVAQTYEADAARSFFELFFRPVLVEDGKDALSKLGGAKIDMVVTDLNMPNIDGIELIKQMRGNAAHKFTPVIMLTTESQEAKKQEGKAAGASGWIVKPFTPEDLTGLVKKRTFASFVHLIDGLTPIQNDRDF